MGKEIHAACRQMARDEGHYIAHTALVELHFDDDDECDGAYVERPDGLYLRLRFQGEPSAAAEATCD